MLRNHSRWWRQRAALVVAVSSVLWWGQRSASGPSVSLKLGIVYYNLVLSSAEGAPPGGAGGALGFSFIFYYSASSDVTKAKK